MPRHPDRASRVPASRSRRRPTSAGRSRSEALAASTPVQGLDPSIVLETKLHPPPARPGLIERVGLLGHLAASEASVVVVSAPAGYGKTVLLSQYAAVAARPFVWLSLDATDADRVLLALELATAIDRVAPVDARVFASLSSAGAGDRADGPSRAREQPPRRRERGPRRGRPAPRRQPREALPSSPSSASTSRPAHSSWSPPATRPPFPWAACASRAAARARLGRPGAQPRGGGGPHASDQGAARGSEPGRAARAHRGVARSRLPRRAGAPGRRRRAWLRDQGGAATIAIWWTTSPASCSRACCPSGSPSSCGRRSWIGSRRPCVTPCSVARTRRRRSPSSSTRTSSSCPSIGGGSGTATTTSSGTSFAPSSPAGTRDPCRRSTAGPRAGTSGKGRPRRPCSTRWPPRTCAERPSSWCTRHAGSAGSAALPPCAVGWRPSRRTSSPTRGPWP